MLVIAVIAFLVKHALGDPVREMVGESVPSAERLRLTRELGLDRPWPVQLTDFLRRLIHADFGASYIYKQSALAVILAKFPATFELVLAASTVVLVVSLPAGIYCAIRPKNWLARTIMALSVVGISVPVFLTGICASAVFSVWLQWLPAFGRGQTVRLGPWETGLLTVDGLTHLVLPALTLASIMLALFIRLVRGAMLDEMSKDYVRTARAKGASPLRVWLLHALRNAMLPIVTIGGLQVGTMLAFTILTETVFQWPGMGFLFLEAVTRSDVPLIVAYLMCAGFLFVLINSLVDLIALVLDPRLMDAVRA